jgi:predicted O-linked N-acetylglucosamine transferase (SPINDLY family)
MLLAASLNQAVRTAAEHQFAGRFAEAESIYREVLSQQPNHREALHYLGILAAQTGRPAVAVELIECATHLNPRDPAAWSDLGNALQASGRTDEAIAAQRRSLELRPGSAQTWSALGSALHSGERFEAAFEAFRHALELDPHQAETHSNLAHTLFATGQRDAAIAEYLRAAELQPASAQYSFNLGVAYQKSGKMDEAVQSYLEATRLDPRMTSAYTNLGVCYKILGRPSLAEEVYRTAMRIEPDDSVSHGNLIFVMNFNPDYDVKALHEESTRWAARHTAHVPRISKHDNTPEPGRRLRIGYLSPDFREHVVGYNALPLLREHDHEQFEIFCYSCVSKADEMTEKFRRCADVWREIRFLSDERVVEMIRADQIDILLDLTMFMQGNRLLVFASKPAPVQVSYLASCSTTGLKEIDYRISDWQITPEGADVSCYTEEVVRLAHSAWCYEPGGLMGEVTDVPAFASGVVTFATRNNPAKVNDQVLELWGRILERVPNSRLFLSAPPGSMRKSIERTFSHHGISSERLEFRWREPWAEFIGSYGRIDVALDPFPYNGWITTCDALWMGVPIVTLSGRTAVGRGGRSILSNIGLSELVAETPDEYVKIASALARDPGRLREMRAGLRERMERSPLRNGRGFARDVEEAYRQMWRGWCSVRCPR